MRIVAIEQDYDDEMRYCQAFREELVYSLPCFAEPWPDYDLVRCFDSNAVPSRVMRELENEDVGFVTGSGHGTFEAFTGQNGIVLWNVTSLSLPRFRGKIVHLLGCEAGAALGQEIVLSGARAFWGYTVKFIFCTDYPEPSNPADDAVARYYFTMDSLIDIGILGRKNAAEIHEDVRLYTKQAYKELMKIDRDFAAALLENYFHLASPMASWGSQYATL